MDSCFPSVLSVLRSDTKLDKNTIIADAMYASDLTMVAHSALSSLPM
jgi:hypothetical protein